MRIVLLLFSLSFCSCSYFQEQRGEVYDLGKPIVRVYDQTLYEGDLQKITQSPYERKDSNSLNRYYVDSWVKRQLWLARKGSLNPQKLSEIDQMVDSYREELIVYALQKKGLNEPIDTAVNDTEVSDYYTTYADNFLLSEPIIQGVLVKCKKDIPDLNKVASLVSGYKNSNAGELLGLCNQFGESCHLNDSVWVSIQSLLEGTPFYDLKSLKENPVSLKYYTTSDQDFVYFFKIIATLKKGDKAPLSFEKPIIKQLILHNRKDDQKENSSRILYSEAKEKNEIEFY